MIYPFRNECCGGYVTLSKKELAQKKADTILASAMEMGAEELITACPLCMYNLDANTVQIDEGTEKRSQSGKRQSFLQKLYDDLAKR